MIKNSLGYVDRFLKYINLICLNINYREVGRFLNQTIVHMNASVPVESYTPEIPTTFVS
jgi:hypothetical protein